MPHFHFGFGCTENDGQKPRGLNISCQVARKEKTQTRANIAQRKNIDTHKYKILQKSCQKNVVEQMQSILKNWHWDNWGRNQNIIRYTKRNIYIYICIIPPTSPPRNWTDHWMGLVRCVGHTCRSAASTLFPSLLLQQVFVIEGRLGTWAGYRPTPT